MVSIKHTTSKNSISTASVGLKNNFCSQCGECCKSQNIVVTKQEIDLIKNKFNIKLKVKLVKPNRYQLIGFCPFYKGQCSIYEDRFCQCRLYHCGRINASDTPKNMLEKRSALLNNELYAAYIVPMEKEAVEYGNKYGWNWRKF